MTLEPATDGIRISTERYFRYVPATAEVDAPDRLLLDWDATLLRVFGRLVAGVTPRTIVVPLSGGGDSRTIGWMLQRLGYPHVLCYSYGTLGNRESDRSRSVARRLGMPWLFVEYDRAKWARWYATSERLTYQRIAEGFSSVAHMQDWPAVWELRRRGDVPDDAVFVPGHALDFLGGSHIPAHLTHTRPGPGRSRTRSGTPTTSCGAATRRSASMRAADWPRRGGSAPRSSRMSWPPSRPGTGRSARRSSSPTLCASTSFGGTTGGFRTGIASASTSG